MGRIKDRRTDAEWRKILTAPQYHVLREKGTERAFSGEHCDAHDPATYCCAACGAELFGSEHKFDSGSGWPSFWAPFEPSAVATAEDTSMGMRRVEVLCARCDGHLGHLFPDGPHPTGMRYCVNSVALTKKPR